jgi:hypothetical protein
MAASFAVHKMVTSGGFLRFESVTSRSLAGTLCLMFFLPSTTNTPCGHEEGELISGKVVLRLAQGGFFIYCKRMMPNAPRHRMS